MMNANPSPRPAPRPASMNDVDPDVDIAKAIWVAVDNSDDLTFNLTNLADSALDAQMARFQDFSKTGLATANLVRYSLTDNDHFPYTRGFRGAPTFCDPRILDRAAGFRPRQDACYASANLVTGVANLVGGTGFVCGTPGHKSGISVGGTVGGGTVGGGTGGGGNVEDNVHENFNLKSKSFNSARYTASSLSRHPVAAASTYPRHTAVGGSTYDTVTNGSVGAKAAYPVTCYQTSCNTIFPCHGRREGSDFDLNLLRI
jgi:hypothetical protein